MSFHDLRNRRPARRSAAWAAACSLLFAAVMILAATGNSEAVTNGTHGARTGPTRAARSVLAPTLASNQGQVIAQNGLTVRAIQVGQNPSTSLPPIGTLAFHQIVTIRCYYVGQTIIGPYGPTDIWDSITGFQTSQHDGVASDAWIYTGSNTPAPTVHGCAGP